jgi:hypothetical protein
MLKPLPENSDELTRGSLLLCALFATSALVAEYYIIMDIGAGRVPLSMLVMLHVIIMMIGGAWIFHAEQHGNDKRLPVFATVMIGVMGLFGAVVCLVMVAIYTLNRKNATPFTVWFSELFPEDVINDNEVTYERIIFGLDSVAPEVNVEPFHDIFSYGTLQQKQMALMKITRYFRPQFTGVLLRAVNDADMAVRVLAATVITKIERNFMEKTLTLEESLLSDPENVSKMKLCAALCDDYAGSGILDAVSEQKSRAKAIELYQQCLAIEPMDMQLHVVLGRLYLQHKQPKKAYLWFKQYIDEHGLTSIDLVLWYMETLLILGFYNKLRSLMKEYPLRFSRVDGEINQAEITAILHCWNQGIASHDMCWDEETVLLLDTAVG